MRPDTSPRAPQLDPADVQLGQLEQVIHQHDQRTHGAAHFSRVAPEAGQILDHTVVGCLDHRAQVGERRAEIV